MRFSQEQVARAEAFAGGTLVEHLGIHFFVDGEGRFSATMPVDHRTKQPAGLLHGGATAALAETIGSMGSSLLIDLEKQHVVGIEVNANHIKGVRSGIVTGTGTVLHAGRSTHVWDVKMTDEQGALVAVCRLTVLVVDRK